MPGAGIVSFRQVVIVAAVLACILSLPAAALPQPPAGNTGLSKEAEIGRKIYLEGTSSTGEPLRAWIRGDVPVSGKIVPCVKCHRRSGMGEREGRSIVRPVTGAALYRPVEVYGTAPGLAAYPGSKLWPVYTDETLADVIVGGIDPKGRVMDPVMPRYDMEKKDLDYLIAYLKSLSIAAPGVTDNVLRFATVVDTRVSAGKRKQVLDVLRTAFDEFNAGTRHETQRARQVPWGTAQRFYAYRLYELTTWELSGPEETWEAQLEEHYRRNPVFALVSGIARDRWDPIQRFCERLSIPYILPNTDLPYLGTDNYSTIYFYKGMDLEAAAIARHLEADGDPVGSGTVVQILRDGEREEAAAAYFRQAMKKRSAVTITDLRVKDGNGLTADFWRNLFASGRPSAIVLWMPDPDLKGLAKSGDLPTTATRIYLSGTLGAGPKTVIPETFAGRAYLAYPFLLPSEMPLHTKRTRIWLKSRKIAGPDEMMQVNTYFAASLVGRVVKAIFTFFSRDYFLEMAEHETENMLAPTVFPRVSLGPGQRFASKGCYVLRYPEKRGGKMTPEGGWIIP